MKFWLKRKQSIKSSKALLSMERLEDRAMMAVIPLASGQTATFHDADGTEVKVKLAGPGQGSIELVGGILTGAAIDTLSLTGTSGQTKLKISTRGGTVPGTTINDVVIDNALNELGALKHFKGKNVWLTGQFTADGDIADFRVRALGDGASVDVTGNVGRFKAECLASNAQLDVSGTLREFVAKLLNSGSQIEANQLDMLKVKQQATGAMVNVGDGGLLRAKLGWVYDSSFSAEGAIGNVVVKGDAMGTAFASNIDRGSDDAYGTIDDFVVDNSTDGYIQSIRFRGTVGTTGSQRVKIVSSGQVGDVHLNRTMAAQSSTPTIWEQAASSNTPLSIIQASAEATGFSDDEIYIAVFGQSIPSGATSGPSYYLSPSSTGGPGVLTTTTGMQTGPTTPNLVTLPSYTISDWTDATQTWGSDLVFPTPPPSTEWTGRIVISAGVPVQAQVAANGTISAPSASDSTDPSTGTFYDFVEFTVTSDANGNPTVDADTSQVDSFGMPLALQFFMPRVVQFSGSMIPSTNDIYGVVDTSNLTVGQTVTGISVPSGAVITSIVPSTPTEPGIVSLNVTLPTWGYGPFYATANTWRPYDASFTGTATNGSRTLNNITTLQYLVLDNSLGTGQPVIASGILAPGTTIVAYDIDAETITLSKPAIASTPAMSTTSFTFNAAGPVGVAAPRDEITSLVNADGLTQFLQGLAQGGNDLARPFLLSTAPFIANGPVPMDGASSGAAPIVITTAGAGAVSANNVVEIDGVLGNTAANGVFEVASTAGNTFTLGSPIANGTYISSSGTWAAITPYGITSVTNGTTGQVVVTAPTTGLSDNDTVVVVGVAGNTGANGTFTVSNVTSTSFTLNGSTNTGNYTFGGYWYEQPTASTPVTGASSGAISISTGSTGSLQANDFVLVSGVGGNTAANGVFQVGTVTPNTSFELGGPLANGGYNSLGTWSLSVTDTSTSQSIITTASTSGMNNGDTATITGVLGNTAVNGEFIVGSLTSTSFALMAPVGNGAYTSGGYWSLPNASTTPVYTATNAGPIVITTQNTSGLANGDTVLISGAAGNTAANGIFTISNVTSSSFTLVGSTGNAAYTGGAVWQELQPITNTTGTATPIVVTTGSTAGLSVGQVVEIQGVAGNTAANGLYVIAGLTSTTVTLGSPASTTPFATSSGTWSGNNGGSGTVTNATRGGEIVITTANTGGLANGDLVEVTGVQGNTAANNVFYVTDITSTTFTLAGSQSSGIYTLGGTWKEYVPVSRLVSPKDLVESLASPQDLSQLNNYYNELIDDFFLNYYTGTINGQTGGGNTFNLVSTAYNHSPLIYSGSVQQVTISNPSGVQQYSGYALQLQDGSGTDPTVYNIIYPFTASNAPSPEIYSPVFGTPATPAWLVANNQQFESASQMIFACDALFADNVERTGIDMNAANAPVLADLENSLAAAFNRGIIMSDPSSWNVITQWFPAGETYNYWTQYWHQDGLTFGDLAYAFPYDDKFGASTNLEVAGVGLVQITLGNWTDSSTKTAATMTVALDSSTPQPIAQQGPAMFDIAFTNSGPTPTGTVALFMDGIPLNQFNNSSNPPVQLLTLSSGAASLSVTLPPTGDAGNAHTYTVTAVYSGDDNYLPTIASMQLQIEAA